MNHRLFLFLILTLVLLLSSLSASAATLVPVASVQASAEHAARPAINLINSSGMDAADKHDNNWANMFLAANAAPGDNPRGGTVTGSYWVEFDLGSAQTIASMSVWNYNELNWASMGLKNVTIEYSTTGSTDPADWTTIYSGIVPRAQANGTGPSSADLAVNFNDVSARYVVITGAMPPNHSYNAAYSEWGLSEVRFYGAGSGGTNWRDISYRQALSNATLQARFQAGLLYELTDLTTGHLLVSNDPAGLDSHPYLFGPSGVYLDSAAVNQTIGADSVATTYTWTSGVQWTITWAMDGSDLVLDTAAIAATAVELFFYEIPGCDMTAHDIITVDTNGTGHTMSVGAYGGSWGGITKNDMPGTMVQPLVALFEGDGAGWVVEGRDPLVGPSNLRSFGSGSTAEMVISRRFPVATTTPDMYEVRIRTYNGLWQDAVDPHIDWMESGLGYVRHADKHLPWVQNIVTQAYVTCGDFAGLSALADRLDPTKTYLGRQAEFRYYAFDQGFPDYRVTPIAANWIGTARGLGFHVGVHINVMGIDRDDTTLIAQMAPGLNQIGTDGYGNPIYDGCSTHVYCSAAYVPWRNHLVAALADVVAAGADVIYLDQTNGAGGKYVVDGVSAIQGVMQLEADIIAAYPNVTIQTEQFNPMASRHASFALTTTQMGHPLSGYIFSPFIKIVPESYHYQPTDLAWMDPDANWGHFTPGASTVESWLRIAEAFQQHDFIPASRLPRNASQMSGYAGVGGVTGFFEQTATTRSFVVYEPGEDPVAYGTRHTNITEWPGPGAIDDWFFYNGSTTIGLDPDTTYWFDTAVTLDPDQFHLTALPGDFELFINQDLRIMGQEICGDGRAYWVFFSGHGNVDMVVPDDFDVYLGSQAVPVNRGTNTASVAVSVTAPSYTVLRAFRRNDRILQGYWSSFDWFSPPRTIGYISPSGSRFPPYGFYNGVAGFAIFTGKLPNAQTLRLKGAFGMRDDAANSRGDGVVRINGTEVVRVDPGAGPPYSMIPFDVDISAFAGQYVMVEFGCDGEIHGADYSDWDAPRIVVNGVVESALLLEPSAITATASSSHVSRPPVNTIDPAGMSGNQHDTDPCNMWLSGTLDESSGNRNAGTDTGEHWLRYDFDRAYQLRHVKLYNYNELNWPHFGLKDITVQHSATGGWDAAEWSTALIAPLPLADGAGLAASGCDLTVFCDDTLVKSLVITAAAQPESHRNWSYDGPSPLEAAGLSQVQFYVTALGPQNCTQAIEDGFGHVADLNHDCRIDLIDISLFAADWRQCMDPADNDCTHPWQ